MIIVFILSIMFMIVFINLFNRKRDNKFDKIDKLDNIIKIMVRSCARWAVASLQDKSPLIAVLHANYAAGYLWALQDCFTDEEIINATGIDVIRFQKSITDVQDIATKGLVKVCPEYSRGLDTYLSKISGES